MLFRSMVTPLGVTSMVMPLCLYHVLIYLYGELLLTVLVDDR